MSGQSSGPDVGPAVELSLPFHGRWLTQNSPARRIPSHGVDVLGQRYAVDFVGVDDRHRTAGVRDWRTFVGTEPPERFVSFGRPVLATAAGTVVHVHDGEPDHEGRRSQLALVPYALGQAGRLRRGVNEVAGNHLIVALPGGDTYVALVHLRQGSVDVSVGQRVDVGQQLAACGNSGNSTQPHLHVQAMDSADLAAARGLPMTFRHFTEWRGRREPLVRERGMPAEGSVVEPVLIPPAG